MSDITDEGVNKAKYKHFAFISYNHSDERWAKRIQSQLRRYRLPSVIRTEVGGDIRIDPIFRYKTSLSVAPLREKICEELDRSRFLIVVCSPHSAKPNASGEHWVNDEIERFVQAGRVNRIMPVIIGGVPKSGDDLECLPPALRENEISAVNLSVGSRADRRHEFLRLVAALFELDPAHLIKEGEEEDRRARCRRGVFWFMLLFVGLLGGVFYRESVRRERDRAQFERDVYPKAICFSYMAAFSRPLIRDCTNRDCVIITEVPKNYNELTNAPMGRAAAVLRDVKSYGWEHSRTNILCTEKRWGLGTIELIPVNFTLSGVSVYMDPVSMLSSVRQIVDYLTTRSPYYATGDRERLAADYIVKFETYLVELLREDPSLKGRNWKLYFVSTRQELENALTEIRAHYRVK